MESFLSYLADNGRYLYIVVDRATMVVFANTMFHVKHCHHSAGDAKQTDNVPMQIMQASISHKINIQPRINNHLLLVPCHCFTWNNKTTLNETINLHFIHI
jgi:hypothetical protein